MLFELDSLRLEAERIANPSSSSFSSSVRPPSPEASPLAERRMEALWSTLERCDIVLEPEEGSATPACD